MWSNSGILVGILPLRYLILSLIISEVILVIIPIGDVIVEIEFFEGLPGFVW